MAARHAPPWLFFLLLIPTGMCSGFCLVVVPYLLTQYRVSVETSSALVALTITPQAWRLAWAPLLDMGLRRRSVHMLAALAALVALLGAMNALAERQLGRLTALLLAMNVAITTSDLALGYLCATRVAPARREQAASFYSAGMLCLGGLGGGMVLALHQPGGALARLLPPLPLRTIGYACALPLAALVLSALFVDEPAPARLPIAGHAREVFAGAWRALRGRRAWTGLVICISPICAGAAANLFGTLADDFHASTGDVIIATGLSAALGGAAGSFAGGRLAARLGSRRAHIGAGLLLAAISLAMALGPAAPLFYVACCLGYSVACGIAFGTFFSFVFELVGPAIGATTAYGFFVCAANLAGAYVTFLDGQMYRFGGRLGLLGCDAATNLLGVVLVLAIHRRERLGPAGSTTTPTAP